MGKNVCVVVLGDIGRSPRMQYHSISLAENGHIVDIVCFRGTKPEEKLAKQAHVHFHYLTEYPSMPLPSFINYVFKAIWQLIQLLFVLLIIRTPHSILVQNPPAVPSLLACYIVKRISGAKLVIDWHNYAYSIMALSPRPSKTLVKLSKSLEKFFGQRADSNLCVSREMKLDLEGAWNIQNVSVLYDRPPERFHPVLLEEKHQVYVKLQERYHLLPFISNKETMFTSILDDQRVVSKQTRPGLLVSSTSWTRDEDFSLLISALNDYEQHICDGNELKLPALVCIITGKGPEREFYLQQIAKQDWQSVSIKTPWLDAEDYPKLLAVADLGVCLHTSSSGFDLPMKIVDMFGCGLPVCAYDFKSLPELVTHDKNGFVFTNSRQLSEQMRNWFTGFPSNEKQLEKQAAFKRELEKFQSLRWSANWQEIAAPIFA